MNLERPDETWHRLRDWTYGQSPSERLAYQIVIQEGFTQVDPSHPLGGRDDGKDAICQKNGIKWILAVYFPRGRKSFKQLNEKFKLDLLGVSRNSAQGIVFVTNQEITISHRQSLKKVASNYQVEIYHLERIAMLLDSPQMAAVRKKFLYIDQADPSSELADIKFHVCPHCQNKVKYGSSLCTECRAEVFEGSSPNERAFDLQTGTAICCFLVVVFFKISPYSLPYLTSRANPLSSLTDSLIYMLMLMIFSTSIGGFWMKYRDKRRKKSGPYFHRIRSRPPY
jgi:hypothetical protein